MHFLTPALLDYSVNGRIAQPSGNRSPWMAPHGVYPCQGVDAWVAIACDSEEQWRALCAATEHPEWLGDGRFADNTARLQETDELDALLAEWTRSRSADEIESILQAVSVPVHRATTTVDAFADAQLEHRQHFVRVEHPILGEVPIEAPRFHLSRTPPVTPLRPGPPFGLDNETVLRELLGMSEKEVMSAAVAGALE
jgi:crotonobetainyl-CoA:carnitine CoA-transferase CaiB-like acyl-CoA transferase